MLNLLVTLSNLIFAAPIPGYLQPNHPAPTGHFAEKTLTEHTQEYEEFEWLWIRDQRGHQGWALKSELILPLDFSRKAQLIKKHTIFLDPKGKNKKKYRLEKPQVVKLLKRNKQWFQISYNANKRKRLGWVRDKDLKPITRDPGYFLLTRDHPLRAQPNTKAKKINYLNSGSKLVPLRVKGDWTYVAKGTQRGYLPLGVLRTRIDLASKVRTPMGYQVPSLHLFKEKIYEIFTHPLWVGTGAYTLKLKEKPSMTSPTVATLPQWSSLTLQGYAIQRWGKSRVPREGILWWPAEFIESNVNFQDNKKPKPIYIKREEILKTLVSPVLTDVSFVATKKGIYRTRHGQYWKKIGNFNQEYPISVSKNGTLFVADQVSFDHGETFRSYIRWDKILETVPPSLRRADEVIRIIDVEPQSSEAQKLQITLKVGDHNTLKLSTQDFGSHWKRL